MSDLDHAPALRPLNFRTLPTLQTLHIVTSFEGVPAGFSSVHELHDEMKNLLRIGQLDALRRLLGRTGFEWRPVVPTLRVVP
jgi:hypothetical protein